MAQQLIQSKLGEVLMVENEMLDLKAILLHSRDNKNKLVCIKVPYSRYLKILSDYWALLSISVEGLLETYANKYKYYVLSNLDGNGNKYKILRIKTDEVRSKCNDCNCNRKRWLNPSTGVCYYKEMINENYTTKI